MGAMKTLYFDIKEASEKIIKELEERPLSTFFGDFQAVNSYKLLFVIMEKEVGMLYATSGLMAEIKVF